MLNKSSEVCSSHVFSCRCSIRDIKSDVQERMLEDLARERQSSTYPKDYSSFSCKWWRMKKMQRYQVSDHCGLTMWTSRVVKGKNCKHLVLRYDRKCWNNGACISAPLHEDCTSSHQSRLGWITMHHNAAQDPWGLGSRHCLCKGGSPMLGTLQMAKGTVCKSLPRIVVLPSASPELHALLLLNVPSQNSEKATFLPPQSHPQSFLSPIRAFKVVSN